MIGCEKLCGRCSACKPIVWAIARDPEWNESDIAVGFTHEENRAAAEAALDPAALADLLARALRERASGWRVNVALVASEDRPVRLWCERGASDAPHYSWASPEMTMSEARAALSRLLALPIDCSAEKALAALEST